MAIKLALVEIVLVETVLVGDPLYFSCCCNTSIGKKSRQTQRIVPRFPDPETQGIG